MRFTGTWFCWNFLLIPVLLLARPAAAAAPAEIDKIISYYKELKSFESGFRQTKKLETVGMELKGSGKLRVHGPAVEWQVLEPAPLLVRISLEEISLTEPSAAGTASPKTQTFSLKEGVAGNRIAASVRPFLELFSGNPAALKKQFLVTTQDGGFALTPRDGDLPVEKLLVFPDAGGTYIARVQILEKSGDRITYEFAKPTPLVSP
jgi:hypothetical protein